MCLKSCKHGARALISCRSCLCSLLPISSLLFNLYILCTWNLQAFELELRREYTEHYLCKQVASNFEETRTMYLDFDYYLQIGILKEVDFLKDVIVSFGLVFHSGPFNFCRPFF